MHNDCGRRPFVLSFLIATLMGAAVTAATAQQGGTKGEKHRRAVEHSTAPAVSTAASLELPSGETGATTVSVTLVADGETQPLSTTAATVGDLLREQDLRLNALDRCSPPLSTPIKEGLHVAVVRVRQEKATERIPIAFPKKEKLTSSLRIGQKKVLQAGKPGERVKTFLCTYKDGKLVRRVKTGETSVKPQTQYVLVGTRGMTLASRGYFGGRRIIDMRATGYGPNDNGRWGARTASGLRPGRGVVAVDPRFIPLGTRLYVEGYGYAVAGDTGGAIKGDRIDLGFDSRYEAMQTGRRKVRVLILD